VPTRIEGSNMSDEEVDLLLSNIEIAKNEIGLIRGNVELFSKGDNVTILDYVGSFNGRGLPDKQRRNDVSFP